MVARLYGFLFLGVLLFALLLIGIYMLSKRTTPEAPKPKTERDRPTGGLTWRVDTRSIRDDTATEISIIKVNEHTENILERRVLTVLVNSEPGYAARLDTAQEDAYQASIKAITGLHRR